MSLTIRGLLFGGRRGLLVEDAPPHPTFAVDIGVVAGGAGYAAELIPGGRRVQVKSVWFSKPSVAVTFRLIKASSPSTVGTSTSGTVVRLGAGGGAYANVKLFTGAPTAGIAIGDVFEMAVATDGSVEVTFGDNGTEPLELTATQALGINVSAACTVVGRIVFQEVT